MPHRALRALALFPGNPVPMPRSPLAFLVPRAFVLVPKFECHSDIVLLTLFGPTAKKNNDSFPLFSKINSIAGAKIDLQLVYAGANAFDVGEVSKGRSIQSGRHLFGGFSIQPAKPFVKSTAAVRVAIFANIDLRL